MKPQLRNFIKNCDTCQRHKADNTKLAGLLQPLSIPEHIWTDISLDFIDGLPTSNGRTTILLIIFQNMGISPLSSNPYTAAQVVQIFFFR
jgi:hypothetical protein